MYQAFIFPIFAEWNLSSDYSKTMILDSPVKLFLLKNLTNEKKWKISLSISTSNIVSTKSDSDNWRQA